MNRNDINAKRHNVVTVDACWLPAGNLAETCLVESMVQYGALLDDGCDVVAVNAGNGAVLQVTGDKVAVAYVAGMLSDRAALLNN